VEMKTRQSSHTMAYRLQQALQPGQNPRAERAFTARGSGRSGAIAQSARHWQCTTSAPRASPDSCGSIKWSSPTTDEAAVRSASNYAGPTWRRQTAARSDRRLVSSVDSDRAILFPSFCLVSTQRIRQRRCSPNVSLPSYTTGGLAPKERSSRLSLAPRAITL